MARFLDMGSRSDLSAHKDLMLFAFGLPIEHPGHMPVTRDLSDAKRTAVIAWLNNPLPSLPVDVPHGGDGSGVVRSHAQAPAAAGATKPGSRGDKLDALRRRVGVRYVTPAFALRDTLSAAKVSSSSHAGVAPHIGDPKNMIRLKRCSRAANGSRDAVSELKTYLQQAIELEHSTIPLYLYGLVSLQRAVMRRLLGQSLSCAVLTGRWEKS